MYAKIILCWLLFQVFHYLPLDKSWIKDKRHRLTNTSLLHREPPLTENLFTCSLTF